MPRKRHLLLQAALATKENKTKTRKRKEKKNQEKTVNTSGHFG